MGNIDQDSKPSYGIGSNANNPSYPGVHEQQDALSLQPEALQEVPQRELVKLSPARAFVKRFGIILGLFALLAALTIIVLMNRTDKPQQTNDSEVSRYGTISLPLEALTAGKDISLPSVSTITINGPMQLNNGLRFAPSSQPNGALPGQLYYDKDVNQLAYFNGSEFVFLQAPAENEGIAPQPVVTAAVQGLGGLTGQIDIGSGLTAADGRVSNAGVLSLMGLTGDVTLNAGRGITVNGTTIGATGISSVASGSPSTLSVATDGDGNVVITSVGAGAANVSTAGGTAGRFVKFTGTDTIADALLRESGSTVTVDGNLAVNGSVTLSTPLPVQSGGTGRSSLTTNGLLLGQGTSAITSVTSGGAGLCLISTAGAPAFSACPGNVGPAVDSLNGLTGALNIANASASGATVTLHDATTSAKGIASFNGTNFNVSGGAVNTAQNINTSATPTFAGVNTNNITPSAALTMGSVTNTVLVQGSVTTLTSNGLGNDIRLDSADTIELLDSTNITGALTATSTATFQGGYATIGTSTQAGVLILNDGSSNTGTFQLAALGQNTVYTLPDPGQATAEICLTSGNCTSLGGTVTSAGGTTNQLAKFTASGSIGDSIISDNGSTVTIAGALSVNNLIPTSALTLGVTSQNAVLQGAVTTITATNGGTTNTLGFAAPSGAAKTITIPNASGTIAVSASGPLSLDANGNLTCATCVTSGGGSTGVDSVNGLTGVLTIANSTGSGLTITIDDATTTTKGIASFNAANFNVSGGAVNTVQDIAVTATPTFAGINTNSLTPSAALTIGATNQTALVRGSVVTIQSNGAGNDVVVDAADSIQLQDNTDVTGTLTVSAALNVGTGNALQITSGGNLTSIGSAAYQGGVITLGTAAQSGSVVMYDGSSNTATIQVSPLAQNVVYNLPDPGTGTATICLTTGNCSGVAGSVTTAGGTPGVYAKFTGAQSLGDSLLSELGSIVTVAGGLNIATGSVYAIDGTQISSAALSNDSNLAKLDTTQTFTAGNTFSGTLTANGNVLLGSSASDELTISATIQGASPMVFEGGTADANQLTLSLASLTTDRTITLPDESGVVCLQNSNNCGFALSGGGPSGDYIHNQTASDQNANFRISGSGQLGSVLTGLIDTATNAALAIGSTNATSINLNQNTTVGAGKSLSLNGGNTASRPSAPTEGMLYFDTATASLLVYANGKWQADRSTATKIVAASNAPQAVKDAADYVADGTADEVEINAALTAAAGGSVYLSEGIYTVSSSISIPNDTKFAGAGKGTLIRLAITTSSVDVITNTDQTTGTGIIIRDLSLDGQSASQTSGAHVGVRLQNVGSISGRAGGVIDSVWMSSFRNSDISLTSCSNMVISNNTIEKSAISVTSVILSGSRNAFTNNSIRSSNTTGTGVSMGSSGSDTTLSGNTIVGFLTGISLLSSGVVVNGNNILSSGQYGILSSGAEYNRIVNNNFSNNNNAGVRLYSGLNANYNTISGNSFYNNGGSGSTAAVQISMNSGTTATGNTISDNVFYDNSGTSPAISLDATAIKTYLSGNTMHGAGITGITDTGIGTIYSNQLNASGDIIMRGSAGTAIGTTSATSTLSVQGSYVGTALPNVAAPTLTTSGTAGSTTYGYAVTAYDGYGETIGTNITTIATGNATLTSTNRINISWTGVSGAVSYKVYRTVSGGTPGSTGLIGTVAASASTTFADTGISATGSTPTINTTGGVVATSLNTSGNIQGGTLSVIGGTGSATAMTVSNGTSTGNIVSFRDGSTTVASIADGGAFALQNTVDSGSAFQVKNVAGTSILNIDTTTPQLTIGSLTSAHGTNTTIYGNVLIDGTYASAIEEFENLTFPPASFADSGTWTTGGTASWSRTTSDGSSSSSSAASGTVSHSQISWLDLDYTVPQAGNLSFDWKVSSESTWDYLVVCIDNDVTCSRDTGYTQRISGTVGWTRVSIPVTVGVHSFRWAYSKDGANSVGSDRGWVDNIRLPSAGTPSSLTVKGATYTNGNTFLGDTNADTLTVAAVLQGGTPLVFEGATADAYEMSLAVAVLSDDRTITLPDETGIICLRNSSNCGFQLAGGGTGSYIENQNLAQQTASNFWISGTGRADGSLLTPALDTATGTALAIGTTNATAINLNENTTVASGKTLTVNGEATFQANADSETAFRILSTAGTSAITADTQNLYLYLDNMDLYVGRSSGAALDISNSSGDSLFTVDTAGGEVNIGAEYQGALLILGSKSTAGDPNGTNGAMYYNANLGDFRCYREGYWQSCSTPSIDRTFSVQDEFLGGNTTGAQAGELGWQTLRYGSGTSVIVFNTGSLLPSAEHPGIMRMKPNDSSGSANSVMAIGLNSNVGDFPSVGLAAGNTVRTTVAVGSASSSTQTLRVGLYNQPDIRSASASGVWWEANPTTNSSWRYCYINGGGTTVCASSGVAISADTFVRLAFKINSTGSGSSSITFTINGVSSTVSGVTLNTSNLVDNVIACQAQTSTSRDCYVDYYQFSGTVSGSGR